MKPLAASLLLIFPLIMTGCDKQNPTGGGPNPAPTVQIPEGLNERHAANFLSGAKDFQKDGESEQAIDVLNELLTLYPNSEAADEAKQILAELEKRNIDAGEEEDSAIESAALKQAMVDVTINLMKKQQTNVDPNAVRTQVENGIIQIRKEIPEFLIVSVETEQQLQAGTQIEGCDEKISDAEAFLNEAGIQLTGLVVSLLPQHKAGTLSPVQTELLAQLIVADMKKTQAALTN